MRIKDQIIEFLKETDHYYSGEKISRHLNLSRTSIWKNIQELRKEGYDIAAATHLGYRLVSVPDKLSIREIKSGLDTKFIGQNIHYFETIPSTMEEACKLGLEGASEGTVVIAEEQTKGKGRLGREWNSPRSKGIYFTLIIRPNLFPTELPKLTLLTSVAVCEAIRMLTGANAKIKWPNDILINQKKCAGILTELNAEIDCVRFVTIGIGINVNEDISLPETAVSLAKASSASISRVRLTQEVLRRFETLYVYSLNNGFGQMIESWKSLSSTIGSNICINDQYGSITGRAVDLDEFGGLMIENEKGQIIKRMSGDVVEVSR